MEILPPWARALGVTHDQIQSWLREGAPKTRLLEWCLDLHKFKEQDYLAWAREYYSLPVIKVDFFEKPVPEELWAKIKGQQWQDSFFPLLEWDGVLFVGCLEPPATPQPVKGVQYILAPRSLQKIWWQALTKPAATALDLPSLDAPAPVATVAPPPPPLAANDGENSDFELAFEIVDMNAPAPSAPPKPPSLEFVPEPEIEVPTATAEAPQEAHLLELTGLTQASLELTSVPKRETPEDAAAENPTDLKRPTGEPEPLFEVNLEAEAPREEETNPEPVFQPVPESIGGLDPEANRPPAIPREPIPEREKTLTELTGGLEGLTFNYDLTSLTEPGSNPTPPPAVEEVKAPSEDTPTEMPLGLSLSPAEKSMVDTQDTSTPAHKLSVPEPAPEPEKDNEMPMGLNFNLNTIENSVETTGVTQLKMEPESPAPVAAPPPAPMAPPPPTKPAPMAPPPPPPGPVAKAMPPPPPPPIMKSSPAPAPVPPPPVPVAAPPRAPVTAPPPVPVATPPPSPGMTPPAAAAPGGQGVQSPTPPPAVQEAFSRMKEHFEQCMVFNYIDEKLVPAYWDASWSLTFNAPPAIDTNPASVFRIVLDSKGPYHGYVSPNPVNDSFFQAWNKARYPEHLTVVPLVDKGEIIGMVLGTTSRVRGTMAPLGFYQSLAQELAMRMRQQKAAA